MLQAKAGRPISSTTSLPATRSPSRRSTPWSRSPTTPAGVSPPTGERLPRVAAATAELIAKASERVEELQRLWRPPSPLYIPGNWRIAGGRAAPPRSSRVRPGVAGALAVRAAPDQLLGSAVAFAQRGTLQRPLLREAPTLSTGPEQRWRPGDLQAQPLRPSRQTLLHREGVPPEAETARVWLSSKEISRATHGDPKQTHHSHTHSEIILSSNHRPLAHRLAA